MAGVASVIVAETVSEPVFAEPGKMGVPQTILLVEDEVFVRKATAEGLESAGYRVLVARNAVEALEALRRSPQPVDLLLTDVVMPGMSGYELAAKFHTLCVRGRILLMSGYAEELALCQLSTYWKSYLGKPFSIPTLLSKVAEVLAGNSFEAKAPKSSGN